LQKTTSQEIARNINPGYVRGYRCNSCRNGFSGNVYNCPACSFDLCPTCMARYQL
jgi:hypothetical protein